MMFRPTEDPLAHSISPPLATVREEEEKYSLFTLGARRAFDAPLMHPVDSYDTPPTKRLRLKNGDASNQWEAPTFTPITNESLVRRQNDQRPLKRIAGGEEMRVNAEQDTSSLEQIKKRKMELIEEMQSLKNEMHEIDNELETLYLFDDESKSKNKLMSQGKKKFNENPEKGLQWMMEQGLINPTPNDVAKWLYRCTTDIKGVSKAAIGDYLGLKDPFVLKVLRKYCESHNFAEMHIVDALRLFLSHFRLPGESQKIERITDNFAAYYMKANPNIFRTPKMCDVLAFSCVLLNTFLHNPNVKDKLSFEGFRAINRDFATSGDTQQSMLEKIYDSIKQQKFKFPNDSPGSLMDHIDYDGWLFKQSSNQFLTGSLSWKRRWFILSDSCLYYFEQPKDKEPRGIIYLQNVGIKGIEKAPRPHTFEIYSIIQDERIKACKAESDGRLVEGRHSVYRFSASTSEELQKWTEAISKVIQAHPATRAF